MVERSRANAPRVPVVVADMAEQPFRPRCAAGVLVAFNTLFNLPTEAQQRRALQQAATLVVTGGLVVVEAFVPDIRPEDPADHVDVVRIDADLVVLRVSRTDPDAGTVSGQHVELRDGAPVRLRPWHLRFADPDGLDRMAGLAGLVLAERVADWSGSRFDTASPMHVSVYRAGPGIPIVSTP